MEKGDITKESVLKALDLLHIDGSGLNNADRAILGAVISKFAGGPVGLKTVAASLAEEESTIEEVNEPYLMQLGFLERTPRGRVATDRAYKHLGYALPDDRQRRLV